MKTPLAIVAAGARTPLGLDARATALSLRAGRTALAGAPFAGAARDQVVAGIVPTIAWSLTGPERTAALAVAALGEALGAVPARLRDEGIAVLLTVSDAVDPAAAARVAASLVEARLRSAGDLRAEVVEVREEGAASAGDALARASALLASRQVELVLWGGAHSDVAPAALRALSDTDRLFDAQHLDAVVPGEGAAFVALVDPVRAGRAAIARLVGAGGATTDATPTNEAPVTGEALLEAMRGAMAAGGRDAPAGWVLSDTGYEALRLREWEMVQVRARDLLGTPYRWDALPQRMGRAGAAHLPLAAAIAAASFEIGHVPSDSVLATAGSDAGRRSALWVRALGGPEG